MSAPTLSLVWDNDVTEQDIADAGGWAALGACRPGRLDDPDVMFPDTKGQAAAGKKVCRGCPMLVLQLCRKENWSEPHGTWGGLSEWERRAHDNAERQRRFRQKQQHAATA